MLFSKNQIIEVPNEVLGEFYSQCPTKNQVQIFGLAADAVLKKLFKSADDTFIEPNRFDPYDGEFLESFVEFKTRSHVAKTYTISERELKHMQEQLANGKDTEIYLFVQRPIVANRDSSCNSILYIGKTTFSYLCAANLITASTKQSGTFYFYERDLKLQ